MRKASQDYGIIIIDDKFVGIALGHDFCAEHEWGTKELKEMCGIPESIKKNMGIACRIITKCPPLVYKEGIDNDVKHAVLFTGDSWRSKEENEKYTPHDLEKYVEDIRWEIEWEIEWAKKHASKKKSLKKGKKETEIIIEPENEKDPIVTAWDGGSFGVGVLGDKEVGYLLELHEAFKNKNVAIATTNLRPNNPFSNTSLTLMIADRVPQEVRDNMYHADKEYFDREDYEEEIGMKKIIEENKAKRGKAGFKYYMACSPEWVDYDDAEQRELRKTKNKTKFDIMYWVNYADDETYGWFTVEEIREWLTGNKKLIEIRKPN